MGSSRKVLHQILNRVGGWTKINYISKLEPLPWISYWKKNHENSDMSALPSCSENSQMQEFKYYHLVLILCIIPAPLILQPHLSAHQINSYIFIFLFSGLPQVSSIFTARTQSIECGSIIRECTHHCHPQSESPTEVLHRWHTFACHLAKGPLPATWSVTSN